MTMRAKCTIWLIMVASLLAALMNTQIADAAYPYSADPINERNVFAEVHPWPGTPGVDGNWWRWNDAMWINGVEHRHNPYINDIMSTFWPLNGPYSVGSAAYAQQIGRDLTQAGVTVAVLDWIGAEYTNYTSPPAQPIYGGEQARMENLLRNMGVKTVIMVDAESSDHDEKYVWTHETAQQFIDRINTVVGWYARRTDLFPNYYRDPRTNQPVVFIWNPGAFSSIDWNGFINWHKTSTPERSIFVAGLGKHTSVEWCRNSLFDGCFMLAGKTNTSDAANIGDVLGKLHDWTYWGGRGQFLVAGAIPGFNGSAVCSYDLTENPVVDRENGAVFDRKWDGVLNTSWLWYKVQHAYIAYNNDGEDHGIEPVSAYPPVRGAGYESCGGRVSQYYGTYSPLASTYYLDRNRCWSERFRGIVSFADDIFDYGKMFSYTPNLWIDTSNSGYLWGDTSRVARNGNATTSIESITYKFPCANSFEVTTYFWSSEQIVHFGFYASADGSNWTWISPNISWNNGAWWKLVYSGALPAGTNYLKIVFRQGGTVWTPQVGQVKLIR